MSFSLTAPLQPFAEFSDCEKYRYLLGWPALVDGHGIALFVLANPSTATAEKTDPTVSRCIAYATRWGYQWCHVVNVRAWRETDPRLVPADPLAIGPENDAAIVREVGRAGIIICGWGALGGARGPVVLDLIRKHGGVPFALALNEDGTPRHPLARGKLALTRDASPVPIP